MTDLFDTMQKDVAWCPHCGYRHANCWEWRLGGDGSADTRDCDRCGQPFEVQIHVDVSYSTRIISDTTRT